MKEMEINRRKSNFKINEPEDLKKYLAKTHRISKIWKEYVKMPCGMKYLDKIHVKLVLLKSSEKKY